MTALFFLTSRTPDLVKKGVFIFSMLLFFQVNAQKFWLTTYEFPGGYKTCIAIAGDSTLYAATPAGIIRSFNQGFRFDTTLKVSNINCLFTYGSSSILAGGYGRIYRSFNNGNDWDTIALNNNYPVLKIIRKQNGNLFAITGATDNNGFPGAGVYYSNNTGSNWTQRNNGLGAFLCVDAIEADKNGRLYIAVADELATGNAGLFYSDNEGQQWNHVDIVIDGQMVINDNIQVIKTTGLTVSPQDSLYISFEGAAINTLVYLNLHKSINDISSNSNWDKIKIGNSSSWWMDKQIGPIHFARNGDRYSSFAGSMNVGGTVFSKTGNGWHRHDEGLGLDITGMRNIQQFVETSTGKIFMVQYADERIYVTDTSRVIPTEVIDIHKPLSDCKVYPNPFFYQLTFSHSDNEHISVSLYNFLGQQVLQQTFVNSATINTAQFEYGIYFYELRNNKGLIANGKVIRQ